MKTRLLGVLLGALLLETAATAALDTPLGEAARQGIRWAHAAGQVLIIPRKLGLLCGCPIRRTGL